MACLFFSVTARAEDPDAARPRWKKRWIASWVAVAAISALDVQSSRGRAEANPLLRNSAGRFAVGRAVLVKSAIAGGFFGAQIWMIRSHPGNDYYKGFTLANSVAAGGLGAVALHNYSLPSPRPVPAHLAPQP